MPAPTNISFLTAQDLGTISTSPTSGTQDVRDAGVNYDVYYKFTAPANPAQGVNVASAFIVGEVGSEGDSSLFQTIVSCYVGPASSPTEVPAQGTSARNFAVQFQIEAGEEYFLKVEHAWSNTPTNAIVNYRIQLGPTASVAVGDILINDDEPGRPAAVRDRTTGEILHYFDMVAGEAGVVLTNGVIGLAETGGGFFIYNSNRTLRTSIPISSFGGKAPLRVVRSESDDFFVFVSGTNPSLRPKIYKIDENGTILQTWTITSTFTIRSGCGVSSDESTAYYQSGSVLVPQPIKRWDLTLDSAMSDLPGSTTAAGYRYLNDILVFTDGSLVTGYVNSSTLDYKVRHFSSTGTLLNTFDYPDIIDRLCFTENYPTEFLIWFQPALPDPPQPGLDHFDTILLADGSILDTVPGRQFESGVYQASEQTDTPDEYFGHSFSCPVLVLLGVDTASITVTKITSPGSSSQEFTFVAGGGLSPGTFSLFDGESRVFDGLTPGSGFSIVENAVAGWTISYEVSNASPNTNIVVGSGEAVVVTVTNVLTTPPPNLRSGIYKIVPGKRQDTLWTQDFDSTEDVKIPDPTAKGPYLGE